MRPDCELRDGGALVDASHKFGGTTAMHFAAEMGECGVCSAAYSVRYVGVITALAEVGVLARGGVSNY